MISLLIGDNELHCFFKTKAKIIYKYYNDDTSVFANLKEEREEKLCKDRLECHSNTSKVCALFVFDRGLPFRCYTEVMWKL